MYEAIRSTGIAEILSTAPNGQDAMIQLEKLACAILEKPDIAFIDINMPLMNGIEILQKVRSSKALRDLPIIIFTSSDREEDIRLAYANGASAFIQKPSEYKNLEKTMASVISYWYGVKKSTLGPIKI